MSDTPTIPAALIAAARSELAEWRREAEGSRRQQAAYEKTAREHRQDAERAETRAAEIADALKSIGVKP